MKQLSEEIFFKIAVVDYKPLDPSFFFFWLTWSIKHHTKNNLEAYGWAEPISKHVGSFTGPPKRDLHQPKQKSVCFSTKSLFRESLYQTLYTLFPAFVPLIIIKPNKTKRTFFFSFCFHCYFGPNPHSIHIWQTSKQTPRTCFFILCCFWPWNEGTLNLLRPL